MAQLRCRTKPVTGNIDPRLAMHDLLLFSIHSHFKHGIRWLCKVGGTFALGTSHKPTGTCSAYSCAILRPLFLMRHESQCNKKLQGTPTGILIYRYWLRAWNSFINLLRILQWIFFQLFSVHSDFVPPTVGRLLTAKNSVSMTGYFFKRLENVIVRCTNERPRKSVRSISIGCCGAPPISRAN